MNTFLMPELPSHVDVVQFDGLVLCKETWTPTKAHCPRCGNGQGAVWYLTHASPAGVLRERERCGNAEFMLFLCVACQFVTRGLEGLNVSWDTASRARQIINIVNGQTP